MGPRLKEEIDARGEWAERFRSNFDHVLAKRGVTASKYEVRTEISFDTNVEFHDYLAKFLNLLRCIAPLIGGRFPAPNCLPIPSDWM